MIAFLRNLCNWQNIQMLIVDDVFDLSVGKVKGDKYDK